MSKSTAQVALERLLGTTVTEWDHPSIVETADGGTYFGSIVEVLAAITRLRELDIR